MPRTKVPGDPTKRHPSTRHRGISYRVRKDGTRQYSVYFRGKYVAVEGGENEALAKQAELRGKAARGERVILPSKLTIAEVGAEHLAEVEGQLRPAWYRDYMRAFERIIKPAWGQRAVSSITAHDVLRLDRELLGRDLSEATVANYLKPARGLFEYAVLQGYVTVNPFVQVPRGRLSTCNQTREHREWTTEEVRRVIEEGYKLDARPEARADYGLAIEMKLRTGARLGELLGVRYADINFEQGIWVVSKQWTREGVLAEPKTKKSKGRRVPLAPDLVRKLAARKLRRGAGDGDFIFAGRGGLPISHTNFRRRAWARAVEAAGLTDGAKITPHDARHAFASEMAFLGLSSADVAEVLGHTTAGITEKIYTHAFNRDQREERVRQAMAEAMAQ